MSVTPAPEPMRTAIGEFETHTMPDRTGAAAVHLR
jgi:hypothetical protein